MGKKVQKRWQKLAKNGQNGQKAAKQLAKAKRGKKKWQKNGQSSAEMGKKWCKTTKMGKKWNICQKCARKLHQCYWSNTRYNNKFHLWGPMHWVADTLIPHADRDVVSNLFYFLSPVYFSVCSEMTLLNLLPFVSIYPFMYCCCDIARHCFQTVMSAKSSILKKLLILCKSNAPNTAARLSPKWSESYR